MVADLTLRCSALHFPFVFTIYKQQFSSSRFCDDIPIIVFVQLRLCPEIFILWTEWVGGQLGIDLVAITTLIWRLKFYVDPREICSGVLEKALRTVYGVGGISSNGVKKNVETCFENNSRQTPFLHRSTHSAHLRARVIGYGVKEPRCKM